MITSPKTWRDKMTRGGDRRTYRSIFVLSFTLAVMTMGHQAEAGFMKVNHENPGGDGFSLVGTGTAFNKDGTFSLEGGANWPTTGNVTESAGSLVTNDSLFISGTALHDANGPGTFTYRFSAVADGFSDRNVKITPTVNGVAFGHGNDTDQFVATGDVTIDAGVLVGGDIVAYNLLVKGKHVTGTSKEFTASAQTSGGSLPGDPFTTVAMILDDSNNSFDITLVTNGITLSGLIGSSLRLGPNGPDIFDLGGPSEWITLGDVGLYRVLDNAVYPQQFLRDLLAGNVFVSVQTTSPGNEMRGQLQGFAPDIAPVPEPSAVVLIAVGSLGLLGFAWRHRR